MELHYKFCILSLRAHYPTATIKLNRLYFSLVRRDYPIPYRSSPLSGSTAYPKMQGEPTLLQKGFTLRDATKADLDDMTEIHIQGFTEEPQVHYCYPRRKRFPYDYDEWTRTGYYRYLQQPNKFQVHVLEAPIESKGKIVVVPVALAVWNTAVLEQAIEPGIYHCYDLVHSTANAYIKRSRSALGKKA